MIVVKFILSHSTCNFDHACHLYYPKHKLFRERLSYKRGKAYATMLKVIMGNGGFCSCLIKPQGVSAWWKETAQTRVFLLPFSLLLNHFEPQSSKTKLLLPIMLIALLHTLLLFCGTTFIKTAVSVSAIRSLLEGPLIFASFGLNLSLALFSYANWTS